MTLGTSRAGTTLLTPGSGTSVEHELGDGVLPEVDAQREHLPRLGRGELPAALPPQLGELRLALEVEQRA